MRRKILDDKFYMPKQYALGTAEKDVTEPTETPSPLSKGFDGFPKFNELQDAQKKNMPKAMRTQVAFQQKKLQWANYQIINFLIKPSDSGTTQTYYFNNYNQAVAVGSPLEAGVMFGTNTADVTRAKYYNIVYANVRFVEDVTATTDFLVSPSYVEFYLMQKIPTGDFGGKIPKQIEAVANSVNTSSITVTGAEYGVQSFGVDIRTENSYYTQSPDLKGIRCCGLALKRISINTTSSIALSTIALAVEVGYDLKTEGNNY